MERSFNLISEILSGVNVMSVGINVTSICISSLGTADATSVARPTPDTERIISSNQTLNYKFPPPPRKKVPTGHPKVALLLGFAVANLLGRKITTSSLINALGIVLFTFNLSLAISAILPWQCEENPGDSTRE